ncbi:MAG: glycerol-3-phosphate dehydrogenase/oxidase [Deltaproteobacteria bacterium]|nr:glycerol-3-phosphate dehydrogenase/oxidase [Deltaproteobacteria bacterium]
MAARTEHDVIILGGGVNGAGIARDCALRGLRVLLVERNDLAKGASGANTGMIHGGIRYLRYDVHTTKMACTDSGFIQKIAPHLLFRIPFLVPVAKPPAGARFKTLFDTIYLELAEVFFEAYDQYQPLKRGKPHTRLTREEALALEPGLAPDILGAVTMDEWGIDPFRLTVENAIDASENGALIKTYTQLVSFTKDAGGRVCGVVVEDRMSGVRESHSAPLVVNATGAWGPRTAALAGAWYRLRPGKGVHIVFPHRISNFGMVMDGVDGRQMFLMPHENGSIVGTTDDDYYGDLDNPRATEDEVKYILQGARRVFPAIDKHRMSRVYVGVRPTLWAWAKNEDRLSREHEIYDHAPQGVPGLLSVCGGKLAAYRQLAEEVSNVVAARVGNTNPCTTWQRPLPGAEDKLDVEGWTRSLTARSRLGVARMAFRHGARTTRMLEAVAADPRQGAHTCQCEPVLEAELRYAAKNELATRLVDLRRRTRLGMGACGGTRCLARASQVLAEERGLSSTEQLVELGDAMTARFVGKRPVLEGANLATEELNQATHFLAGNLGPFLRAAREQVAWAHAVPAPVPADAPAARGRPQKRADVVIPPPVPDRA